MELLGEYVNGNYDVTIFSDGTKVRETQEDAFVAEFPECMDVKITNYCDMGCPFCHEDSTTDGLHGDILNSEFIDSLYPFTEMAIGGGNPLSHPDLEAFLKKLKAHGILPNLTVNQKHFLKDVELLKRLSSEGLVYGLGVSVNTIEDGLLEALSDFPNAVIHVINGVISFSDLTKLTDKDLKVLILGYKEFRKGEDFYSPEVEEKKKELSANLYSLLTRFQVISFDNLALKQLDVRSLLSEKMWSQFYMGDDGQHTMYIDLVERKYARNSTSTERHDLTSDIKEMFKNV